MQSLCSVRVNRYLPLKLYKDVYKGIATSAQKGDFFIKIQNGAQRKSRDNFPPLKNVVILGRLPVFFFF